MPRVNTSLKNLIKRTVAQKSLFAVCSVLFLLAGCSDSNPPTPGTGDLITDPQSPDLDITLSESAAEPVLDAAQSEAGTRRPDIILVVSDDQRWDLMSSRGHQFVKTPNLDAMASTGAMMENAFVPVALCSPSRGALLTGRDVHKASAPRIVWKNNSFLETQRTIAEEMQAAGYTTAYVGKWHLGEGSKPKRGFDHWESFDWLGDFFDPVIHINGERQQFEGFVDDILAERATSIIKANEDGNKPLFMVVGLKEPHLWFEHPPRRNNDFADVTIPRPDTFYEDFAESGKLQEIKDWLGVSNFPCGLPCFNDSWDTYIRFHYRAIQGLDDAIGTIRNGINDGLQADNTLFIYTSDNGYSLGDHGLTEKHFVYEEPIRVPLLVDAPGSADAGKRISELISTIDIAPTVLDYAGIEIPQTMTGRSMQTLLSDDVVNADSGTQASSAETTWRDQLFFMYEKAQVAVRTAEFKLIRSLTVDGHFELYDLVNDPKETRTVYSDPAYASARQEMHRRLKSIIEENQWSARKTYPVRNVLASQPIPTDMADRLSQELSAVSASSLQEGVIDVAGQSLQFENMRVGAGNFDDRFPLKEEANSNDGQSVLVVLPIELLTDWDPFIEIKIRRRTQATMYHAGRELWNNTAEERLPLDAANPPLYQGTGNFVVLRFDDSGAMDVKLEIESPEDTLRLSLEEQRLLGNAPGRFNSVGGWQAHNDVEISREVDALLVRSSGNDAQLQTENIYADQPVHVVIEYSAEQEVPASVFWRSQHGNYDAQRRQNLALSAGNNNLATLNLEGVTPEAAIDALRLDIDAEDAAIRMHALSVYPLQPDGSVGSEPLHLWHFN